jgi:hypothetical protein
VCEYSNGDKYEGEWENGVRHGLGIVHFHDGGYYHGEVSSCFVPLVLASVTGLGVSSQFADDRMDGKATRVYSNGDKYFGKLLDCQPHNRGIMRYANGDLYTGKVLGLLCHLELCSPV